MNGVETETRHRRPHTRSVSYRSSFLDPHLEFRRKLKTASFLPVVSRIFAYVKRDLVYPGMSIARSCRGRWSQGTVWKHLHYLLDKGILQPKFDGKQMWFSWPKAMSDEARKSYMAIVEAIKASRRAAQRPAY
jgi:hypothetical protein